MILTYYNEEFDFEILEETEGYFVCYLTMDNKKSDIYDELLEKEGDEFWYLDDQGNRLDTDELFNASPWKLQKDDVTIKLLLRICLWDGCKYKCTFQKAESYLDWNQFLVNKHT